MTYTDCFTENCVKYCKLPNGNLIVGDNSTSHGNAAISGFSLSSLEIPETVNQRSIEEIGRNAFSNVSSLTSVSIKARIKQINTFAFFCCSNVVCINIPSSTLFIGYVALSFKNSDGTTSKGTIRIIFDYPANVKYIARYDIERKKLNEK